MTYKVFNQIARQWQPLTVATLMEHFTRRLSISLHTPNGSYSGVISSLQHEDGSGRSYNVLLQRATATVYVRCDTEQINLSSSNRGCCSLCGKVR